MSTEDVRIRVQLDTTEAKQRTGEMERGFERLSRAGSSGASMAFGKIAGAAGAVFGATFGQRYMADVSTLASSGTVSDISQNLSNWTGMGGAARRVQAVNMARDQTAAALGIGAANMPESSMRSIFHVFQRLATKQVEGQERIRVATETDMSKASENQESDFKQAVGIFAGAVNLLFGLVAPNRPPINR